MSITQVEKLGGRPQETMSHSLFGGQVKVLVYGTPWNFGRAIENKPARQTIGAAAASLGVKRVYLPDFRKAFNAEVIAPDLIHFPQKREEEFGVSLWLGAPVDGVELKPGTALLVPSADCHTFVVRWPNGTVVAAHAGRDCLIDRSLIDKGTRSRLYESVVFTALAGCPDRSETKTALLCGIGPRSFSHNFGDPKYGSFNEKLHRYVRRNWGDGAVYDLNDSLGRINPVGVVKGQLEVSGVRTDPDYFFFDGVDTHNDMRNGQYLWHSYRRNPGSIKRNGVLVARLE